MVHGIIRRERGVIFFIWQPSRPTQFFLCVRSGEVNCYFEVVCFYLPHIFESIICLDKTIGVKTRGINGAHFL